MEVAKKLLALYLSSVPTYSVVYGAFATVPILLVWIYVAWTIVLLGAALTAYVPSLLAGIPRRRGGPGWQFQLALEVLQQLDAVRGLGDKGKTIGQLCASLQTDSQRLEPVLEALMAMDWIGQLSATQGSGGSARMVLLVDPTITALEPLLHALLLPKSDVTHNLWKTDRWPSSSLRDVL
jgi:membrane protein